MVIISGAWYLETAWYRSQDLGLCLPSGSSWRRYFRVPSSTSRSFCLSAKRSGALAKGPACLLGCGYAGRANARFCCRRLSGGSAMACFPSLSYPISVLEPTADCRSAVVKTGHVCVRAYRNCLCALEEDRWLARGRSEKRDESTVERKLRRGLSKPANIRQYANTPPPRRADA
ncbi:hypothetical protein DFH27DRAFT_159759 [Peziza echinospora]|nr:hypothetical protein DFH27DRAFT_159759 [Peziza echinospora]